jgi:hypothetical protein
MCVPIAHVSTCPVVGHGCVCVEWPWAVQMYPPPPGHKQVYDALTKFPAPQCGLPNLGLSCLSTHLLANVPDVLESESADAGCVRCHSLLSPPPTTTHPLPPRLLAGGGGMRLRVFCTPAFCTHPIR